MNVARYWIVTIISLWLAAALQETIAPKLAVENCPPDFILVILASLALLSDRKSGALTGFFAGVLRGVLAGSNLTYYVMSRTVLGYGLGWIRQSGLIPNATVAGLSALLGTIVSQGLVMLFAHRGAVLPFLGGTIVSAVINGALALPTYALLRRLIDPRHDR